MDMRFSCYIVLGVLPSLAMSEEMLFPLDVQILNKQLEISAYLDDEQEDSWALEGNELLPTLIESLKPSRLETLRGVFSDRKVTQDDFKQLGWEADYDTGTLVVQIKVPVADKRPLIFLWATLVFTLHLRGCIRRRHRHSVVYSTRIGHTAII